MAQPRTYTRQYNFNDFQTTSPASPLPGSQVDGELNKVKLTLDDLNTNIALIQQDDGKIKNQAVHKDSFDAGALALMSTGSYTVKGDWVTSTSYSVGDLVDYNGSTYVATSAHTSSSAFQTDLTANKWILIANAGIASTASAVDKFEGTGSQTAFTLTYTYSSNTDVLVFVNGALKNPGDDYSISGTTLTFVTAPSTPAVSGNENVIIWGASVVAQAAKESAETAKTNAQGFANEADNWARKTNGLVESTDYSSKAYAIGGTGVDTASGSAKDWATKTSGTVGNTSEYSAKYYATNANVGTVATNIASVNTVAGIGSSALNAIAGKETEIGLLGQATPIANMAVLGDTTVIANIATCATDITNINNASTNATKSQNYAIKVDGAVESTNYSAKAWAIGGTGVTDSSGAGSAKSWAVEADLVDGTEHSAKSYAISGTAISDGSAKQWAVGGGSSFTTATVVASGLYSAKYYAEQAQNSASSAGNSLSTFQAIWQGSGTTPPTGGTVSTGDLFYNSTVGNSRLQVYNGSSWVDAAVDASGVASPGFAIAMGAALG
tara:strand:+ start:632 stop:2290 length:1659 start_codon:yes stop_codon:yes gene_type:complete